MTPLQTLHRFCRENNIKLNKCNISKTLTLSKKFQHDKHWIEGFGSPAEALAFIVSSVTKFQDGKVKYKEWDIPNYA